jgi:hypothetical protein
MCRKKTESKSVDTFSCHAVHLSGTHCARATFNSNNQLTYPAMHTTILVLPAAASNEQQPLAA